MPSWRIHISLNIILFFFWSKAVSLFFPEIDIFYLIFIFPLTILASVFPDIDTSKSRIRDWTASIIVLFIALMFIPRYSLDNFIKIPILLFCLYLFFRFFPMKHKGFTHKLLFTFIFSLVLTLTSIFIYPEMYLMTFSIIFISYITHILLDNITKK